MGGDWCERLTDGNTASTVQNSLDTCPLQATFKQTPVCTRNTERLNCGNKASLQDKSGKEHIPETEVESNFAENPFAGGKSRVCFLVSSVLAEMLAAYFSWVQILVCTELCIKSSSPPNNKMQWKIFHTSSKLAKVTSLQPHKSMEQLKPEQKRVLHVNLRCFTELVL